jgi:hypothetical protein
MSSARAVPLSRDLAGSLVADQDMQKQDGAVPSPRQLQGVVLHKRDSR